MIYQSENANFRYFRTKLISCQFHSDFTCILVHVTAYLKCATANLKPNIIWSGFYQWQI